jgi:Ala-tRNA(Pro) deacylase
MRAAEYLTEQDVPFEALPHPPAYSAQKLAKALRVKGGEVAKAVLLHGPGGYFLAVLPATRQADLAALAAQQGGPVRLADAAEVAAVFRDCEWGAVSAFGNLYGLPTLLDEGISADMWIVVEAGSHVEAVRLSCRDFERLAGTRRSKIARKAVPLPG